MMIDDSVHKLLQRTLIYFKLSSETIFVSLADRKVPYMLHINALFLPFFMLDDSERQQNVSDKNTMNFCTILPRFCCM